MEADKGGRLMESDYLYEVREVDYERPHGIETLPAVWVEADHDEDGVVLNAADLRELLRALEPPAEGWEERERLGLGALDYSHLSGQRVGSEKDPYP